VPTDPGADPAQVEVDVEVDVEAEVEAFMGHVAGHAGAAVNAALVALGDQLGLWTAMAGAGPLTDDKLAERAQVDRRHLREWLAAQATNGMVVHRPDAEAPADPARETFELTDAGAAVLAALTARRR
jgi:hypothetical protein